MTDFFSRLTRRIAAADSLLCIGLDPHPEHLPRRSATSARDFSLRLIEACAPMACAFKPNSAFFEIYGAEGWDALRDVIEAVPEGIPVVLDAKRGDIASTAAAYGAAAFEYLGADALTVNPYLGRDAIEPLVADPAKGVFLLCKTSNPGADDLQGMLLAEVHEPLYVHLARQAHSWSAHDNLGLVVGATDPAALAAVREVAPQTWLLTPGIGAQGGDLDQALMAGLRDDGLGMIVSVSRGISQAKAPAEQASRLRDAINQGRRSPATSPSSALSPSLASLADEILDLGCVRFGEFTLKSGQSSPIYIDLRLLVSNPGLLSRVARAYVSYLKELRFDRLAGIPYAGLPIAAAISIQSDRPMIYPRKEIKSYGTGAEIEGGFEVGERVLVIDDLVTSAGSKLEAIQRLEAAGLMVEDVLVLIDRQGGGAETLSESGYRLHAVFQLSALLDHWHASGKISEQQRRRVREFLKSGD